jgi:hypothetical protein
MIDFGTLENHRVITQSLNHAEWDLVRVFVRKPQKAHIRRTSRVIFI